VQPRLASSVCLALSLALPPDHAVGAEDDANDAQLLALYLA